MKKIIMLAAGIIVSSISAGCVSSYYAPPERDEFVQSDTTAMTKEDVIALSQEGIANDVIISQIKATNSSFELSTDDIIQLKKAGVNEKVINAVIKTGESSVKPRRVRRVSYYPAYPQTILYRYPWYSSPHYSSWYGFYQPYGLHSTYGPNFGGYSGGHGYFGGSYGAGHYSSGGGHRSFGGHR